MARRWRNKPTFHMPVFVVTEAEREPVDCVGPDLELEQVRAVEAPGVK